MYTFLKTVLHSTHCTRQSSSNCCSPCVVVCPSPLTAATQPYLHPVDKWTSLYIITCILPSCGVDQVVKSLLHHVLLSLVTCLLPSCGQAMEVRTTEDPARRDTTAKYQGAVCLLRNTHVSVRAFVLEWGAPPEWGVELSLPILWYPSHESCCPPPPKVVGKSPDCRTFQQFRRVGGLISSLLGNCPKMYRPYLHWTKLEF